jgi:hypothetical protein
MALDQNVTRPGRKAFLFLVLLAILATRLVLILATPTQDTHIDLSIYQEVGELVVHGVDPYDFTSKSQLREQLRQNTYGASASVRANRDQYNYFVSSNAPGSVALYAIIERATGGNPTLWRIAFALGDIAIALCAWFFLRRAGVNMDDWRNRLTFASVVVAYPSLLISGTIVSEDKQFQTALMLLFGGLLLAPEKTRAPQLSAFATGVVGAFSIAFKVLGAILIPVAIMFYRRRPWKETTTAIVSFVATMLAFFIYFDASFVTLVMHRATEGSSFNLHRSLHASPWVLLPSFGVAYLRPFLCALLIVVVLLRYYRGQLDLLNSLAAINVVFICLWITGGSMDRMNIAMLFAMMCIATLSVERWRNLCLVNLSVQLPIYTAYVARVKFHALPWDFEVLDVLAATTFLLSYFYLLLLYGVRMAGSEASLLHRTPSSV